jgi:hypothetical protein
MRAIRAGATTKRATTLIALLLLLLSSCADDGALPAYRSVLIAGVPHVRQKPQFQGEACAEMYLRKLGENIDQDYVFDRAGLDPSLGRGLYAAELTSALQHIGFEVGDVFSPMRNESQLAVEFEQLHSDLLAGIPSIVCMHYSDDPGATEHFRLVLGYDARTDEIIYHEPATADGAYRRMARDKFLELWPLRGRELTGTIRLRLEPGDLEYGDPSQVFSDADFAQHVIQLRPRVPEGFTVLVEKPFVVIGDGHPVEVSAHARNTVRTTVELLKQDFFARDPDAIIDIWLFHDDGSYRRHARELFHHEPDTPYGYYSEKHRALIMNIATGGGTLVHEIVHPFVRANFPGCPAWFNEGLASLYERPTVRGGHIHGLPNWRIHGLKTAIGSRSTRPLAELMALDEGSFYGDRAAVNYAQARYLCHYLQQRGLLVDYYHAFYENRTHDPTGYRTLLAILGADDLDAFTAEWEAWVMQLREV